MPSESALDPENRELYTALLRSPDGYRFDHAVATTYSLDFETALAIPAATVFRDAENRDEILRNPLALLQGVERMASRMAIYCDRGRIKTARPHTARLMALYERTITEISAPQGGAFHPKLWCIRFQPEPGKAPKPVLMRLAILSRNLTNDRSWDLALCLDGTVEAEVCEGNEPLVALLRALPRLANAAAPAFLPSLLRDLEHCRWQDLPAGARKVSFAVKGLDAHGWSPQKGQRIAIMSPFLSNKALEKLAEGYDDPASCMLVARAEELDKIKPDLRDRFTIQTFHDQVAAHEEDDREALSTVDLEGLHAKAYIVERGADLHLHLGSANATNPAMLAPSGFGPNNIEVMATLIGRKTRMGTIEDILFSKSFTRFLTDYAPSLPQEPDATAAAEKVLEALRTQIAALALDLRCTPSEKDIALEVGIAGTATWPALPAGVRCFMRPLTVANEQGHDATTLFSGAQPRLALGALRLSDVTRWLGVRLRHEDTSVEIAFTLGARLIDLPEGRDAAMLRDHIANADNFFRYLRMLLGSLGEGSALDGKGNGEGQWLRRLGQENTSLLEPMIHALNLGGEELAEVDRLLGRLRDPASDTSLVPPDFLAFWASFSPLLPKKDAKK